jgi:hypothetical protein
MAKPKPDRFDEMLANWKTLLPLMRDKWGRSNCPLTAEAVWKYFLTGEVVPARVLLTGETKMLQCGDSKAVTIKQIRNELRKKGHGMHAVVTANPGEKDEHNFNVVNIRGTVYLVDAYNASGYLTADLEGSLKYARRLELSHEWDMHLVPAHVVETFKCPPKR